MKESEVIRQFLGMLEDSKRKYKEAEETVRLQEKKETDYMHKIEFAKDKAERNRVATEFQRSRRARREAKDQMLRVEKITRFAESNSITIKRMEGLLREQIRAEEYLDGERHYNERVKEH